MALVPQIRRALPEAKLPFQRPAVLAAMLGSATAVRLIAARRSSARRRRSSCSGLLSVAPAALALRGSDVAAYHGAEHISIGSYEHGERARTEHERCGSHLLGPLLATTALGNILAARAPATHPYAPRVSARSSWPSRRRRRSSAGWCATPTSRSRVRSRSPATSCSTRVATAEPTPEQIEVAEAALAACLELEES